MEKEKLLINRVRAFYFMAGLLKLQGTDPRALSVSLAKR